jgi:hypothetical protein
MRTLWSTIPLSAPSTPLQIKMSLYLVEVDVIDTIVRIGLGYSVELLLWHSGFDMRVFVWGGDFRNVSQPYKLQKSR